VAQGFQPMNPHEMKELEARCRPYAADGRFELSLSTTSSVATTAAGQRGSVPRRKLGKTEVEVSVLGVGGFHMGAAKDQAEATEIVQQAMDARINFFDNCWEYHDGVSEERMGREA
jgi:hypothetical protein